MHKAKSSGCTLQKGKLMAKIIEKYIKEQEFYKRDTAGDIRDVFDEMVETDMSEEQARSAIVRLVSAIKGEYGE